jgi:regulatory protein|tara:strand:+ start:1686 stop:2216 length:531 start_codon:yes stop_codon:yes gene_type:complete
MISENYKKIEAKAFWYLERYASSSKNLKDYLRKKVRDTDLNHDSELIISQIINNLEKQNILNDGVFSESKAKTFINKGWSLSKIKFRLKQLGINNETIDICIENIKTEEADIELIAASKLVKKRFIGSFRRKELDDKLKNREFGILARAGFNYALSKKVLYELSADEIEEIISNYF